MNDETHSARGDQDACIIFDELDRAVASDLHASLKQLGLSVAFAEPADVEASSRLLDFSHKAIVLWSHRSVRAGRVIDLATRAFCQGTLSGGCHDKIVPVLLEDADLPAPFNTIQSIKIELLDDRLGGDFGILLSTLGAAPIQGDPHSRYTIRPPRIDRSRLPETTIDLFGREAELAELLRIWAHQRDSHQKLIGLYGIHGPAGVGKTALVNAFISSLSTAGWQGARGIFAWNFQRGESEAGPLSAQFFEHAFAFFTRDAEAPPADSHAIGLRLAEIVEDQRFILILDGLEGLQLARGGGKHVTGVKGNIRDPALDVFLRQVADGNHGLCIVTTREEVSSLIGNTGCRFDRLGPLNTEAGISLMLRLGVASNLPDPLPPDARQAFERAVEHELRGHPYALIVAANYLVEHHDGDVAALAGSDWRSYADDPDCLAALSAQTQTPTEHPAAPRFDSLPESRPDRPHVFISYRSLQTGTAATIQQKLEDAGLLVWRDSELGRRHVGHPYPAVINTALDASQKVLLLWSQKAAESDWVRGEALKAHAHEKLIPLLLDDTPLPQELGHLHALPIDRVNANFDCLLGVLGAASDPERPGLRAIAQPEIDLSKLPSTYASRLFGREREMADLLRAWDRLPDAEGNVSHVYAYDAMGGAGKTALVYHFTQGIKHNGWRGAQAVFAWSFYSQGSNEDRQIGSAEFFNAAFNFFTDGREAPPPETRMHERGTRLADLVQKRRTLLILDGLEPLQFATGKRGGGRTFAGIVGGIKDRGIKALLFCLADYNPGLCIVTTRIELAELQNHPHAHFEALDRLSTPAGVALLRYLRVEPAFADPVLPPPVQSDFDAAVDELDGHALALTLAGNYLADHHQGSLKALRNLPSFGDIEARERNAYRVIRAIEIALVRRVAEQGAVDNPASTAAGRQLGLLFFLGFFDRPAVTALLPVVFPRRRVVLPAPATDAETARVKLVRNLFDWMHELPVHELRATVAQLQSQGLVAVRAALGQLQRQGLIGKNHEPKAWDKTEIDCHPLVREYFGQRLRELDLPSYQTAHGRLYDHYRFAGLPEPFREPVAYAVLGLKSAYPSEPVEQDIYSLADGTLPESVKAKWTPTLRKARPEHLREAVRTLKSASSNTALAAFLPKREAEVTPLFWAIAHGCAAGREDEAFSEVYWPRVEQGRENLSSGKKDHLYGQELTALACFFASAWSTPSPSLIESHQALVLTGAGFRLRSIGRLEDAAEAMFHGTQRQVHLRDWINAAIGFNNLSEILATLGRLEAPAGDADPLAGAISAAKLSIRYADQSGNGPVRMMYRTTHAHLHFQLGNVARAEILFRDSERIQMQLQPTIPQLYSIGNYEYGELLLSRGRVSEVIERSKLSLELSKINKASPISFALDSLILARALFECGIHCMHDALTAVRQANDEEVMPNGLLFAAESVWLSGDSDEAKNHLREVEAISVRGPMPLYAADAALLRARIAIAANDLPAAKEKRNEAADLIARYNYGRREPDLAMLNIEIAFAECAGVSSAHPDTRSVLQRLLDEAVRVIERGWWFLIPRLEALQPTWQAVVGSRKLSDSITRLRQAEAEYNSERDKYLQEERKRTPRRRWFGCLLVFIIFVLLLYCIKCFFAK